MDRQLGKDSNAFSIGRKSDIDNRIMFAWNKLSVQQKKKVIEVLERIIRHRVE